MVIRLLLAHVQEQNQISSLKHKHEIEKANISYHIVPQIKVVIRRVQQEIKNLEEDHRYVHEILEEIFVELVHYVDQILED